MAHPQGWAIFRQPLVSSSNSQTAHPSSGSSSPMIQFQSSFRQSSQFQSHHVSFTSFMKMLQLPHAISCVSTHYQSIRVHPWFAPLSLRTNTPCSLTTTGNSIYACDSVFQSNSRNPPHSAHFVIVQFLHLNSITISLASVFDVVRSQHVMTWF